MTIALVVLLGVVQGLTEFLPISSSGHLRLAAELFGVAEPQTLFDIMLHVGSLAAVFFVYRRLFGRMITASLAVASRRVALAEAPEARMLLLALVATAPTFVIAMLIGHQLEALASDVAFIGGALVFNGLLLLILGVLSRRLTLPGAAPGRSVADLRVRDALVVGTIQGLGIVRGVSRSGSTITAGLLTGLDRETAAAFSFVMSVPAILGALVMELDLDGLTADDAGLYALGALVAAVSGTLALQVLLRLLEGGRLHHFAWYCFAVGAAAMLHGASP